MNQNQIHAYTYSHFIMSLTAQIKLTAPEYKLPPTNLDGIPIHNPNGVVSDLSWYGNKAFYNF